MSTDPELNNTELTKSDGDVAEAPRRADVEKLFASSAPAVSERLRGETRAAAHRLFGTAEDRDQLSPGDYVGPYRIESLLGLGGQGYVYEASHRQMGRRVALKVPRSAVAERLLDEARIAARIEHPRIVRVEDIRADAEVPYLVLERCGGGSLEAIVEQHPSGMPLERVREVGAGILEALSFVHGRRVVHRDVKPANVLFDDDGQVKLSDLGIGTLATGGETLAHSVALSATSSGAKVAGTPVYMAPEQENPSRLKGASIDGRADLFSFGKLLFVMLTGGSPATIRPPSRLRKELDSAWDELVFKLVEENRDDRFENADEVLAALRAIPTPTEKKVAAKKAAARQRAQTAALEAIAKAEAVKLPEPSRQIDQSVGVSVAFGVFFLIAGISLIGNAAGDLFMLGVGLAGIFGAGLTTVHVMGLGLKAVPYARPSGSIFQGIGAGVLMASIAVPFAAAQGLVNELVSRSDIGWFYGLGGIGACVGAFLMACGARANWRGVPVPSEGASLRRATRFWSWPLLVGGLTLLAIGIDQRAHDASIIGLGALFAAALTWNVAGAWPLRPRRPLLASLGLTSLLATLATGVTGLVFTIVVMRGAETAIVPIVGAGTLAFVGFVALAVRGWRRRALEAPAPVPALPPVDVEAVSENVVVVHDHREKNAGVGVAGVIGRIFAVLGGLASITLVTVVAVIGFIAVGFAAAVRGCQDGGGAAELSGGEVGLLGGLVLAVAVVTIGVLALLIRLFRNKR